MTEIRKYREAEEVRTDALIPYERNAKVHDEKQIKNVAQSIRQFGFVQPLVIDRDNVVVIGHCRLLAAKKLGLETVPCIKAEDLTDEEIRRLRIIDNKVNESPWDTYLVGAELETVDLQGYDFSKEIDWFETRRRDDDSRQEGNTEYNEFLDKFEEPKTTDDCYTPDVVYDAVADYVAEKFKLNRKNFVRPFYPGGDYEKENYKPEDVVVDNPPFSILAQITRFYGEKGIPYFLFAPALTAFAGLDDQRCAICTGVGIIYENKANVSTSFVTNLMPEYVAVTDPELYRRVDAAAKEYAKSFSADLPKYVFPDEVATAARMDYICNYGQTVKSPRVEARRISSLDAMGEKGIFGGALLLSEKAAAEKAAAEKAAAEKAAATTWKLSEREKAIVRELTKGA